MRKNKTLINEACKGLFLFLMLLLLLPVGVHADSWNGWVYQDPYPTSSTILGVKFITPEKGWLVGEYGTILYTGDGGNTWEGQESGAWDDLKSVTFVNERSGWAVGNAGVIVHTIDGGKTWQSQGDVKVSLNKVFFIDEKDGWVVGDRGMVFHTSDAGNNWERIPIGERQSLASIFFINKKTGWLVAGKNVYRTIDGGKNWEVSALPVNSPGEIIDEEWWRGDVSFVDENRGWAVVGLWDIYHTIDGGKTWEVQLTPSNFMKGFEVATILFKDAENGCAAGTNILCTEDGGKVWKERLKVRPASYDKIGDFVSGFWGLSFPDKTTAWAGGHGGLIMKSEDGGKSWGLKAKKMGKFMSIFIDGKTGFGEKDRSIIRTDDGGDTWRMLKKFDMPTGFDGGYFFNSSTGWLGGTHEKRPNSWNSYIIYTNDGGKTWTTQYDEPGACISDIYFLDQSTGWAVGEGGLVLYTKDGGKNWVHQKSGTDFLLQHVFFVDTKKGWILADHPEKTSGEESMVLHTEDGGKHWQVQLKTHDLWLEQVIFTDNKTGWISTVSGGGPGEGVGEVVLLHTRDGGKTWLELKFADISYGTLVFIDKDRGVLAADKGRNYVTKDGGKTWQRRRELVRKDAWKVSELFN